MTEMAQVAFAPFELPKSDSPATNAPAWSGIRALMLAVLEDAVHSLESRNSLVRAEAELWMTSRDRRYVFSFVVICETLNLEPSAVRRSVIRLLEKKRGSGRLMRRSRPNVRHGGVIQVARADRHSAGR